MKDYGTDDLPDSAIGEAKKRFNAAHTHWKEIYRCAKEDLRFLSDAPDAQWDAADYEYRIGRKIPTITVDQCTQFINQVTNDIRMNTPSVNVIPAGGGGDYDTAQMIGGLIKNIEQDSNADAAYDNAAHYAVKCGVGFVKIEHDYVDEVSFEQTLWIRRVINPLAVFLDPNSTEHDGSDAKFGFILETMHKDEFQKRWPKAVCESFFEIDGMLDTDVVIAECYEVEEDRVEIGLTLEGEQEEVQEGVEYAVKRFITRKRVVKKLLSGADVLEESVFPGKYVPLVPVYGEEAWIDGERNIYSLIRRAKQAQMMFNYWKSTEAAMLRKAPKAPVVAAVGTTEDFAEDWLNPDKATVLRYQPYDESGRQMPAPQIGNSVPVPTGIVTAAQQSVEDIKATMGLYNAFLGQRSNETSGVAINARKQEGDRAVFHFADNLNRSIRQVGRIIVAALPDVFVTPRLIRVIGIEDDTKEIGINGALAEGQETTFDFTTGIYSVKVVSGPSYATMRQAAVEMFQHIMQNSPEMMNVFGDLYFKYMDFPGAQAISERIRRGLIDPRFLQAEEGDQDPMVAQLQMQIQELQGVLEQGAAEMQQMQQQLESKEAEIQIKAQDSQSKTAVDVQKLQIEAEKMRLDFQTKQAEIDLKNKELALKEAELELKRQEAASNYAVSLAQAQISA